MFGKLHSFIHLISSVSSFSHFIKLHKIPKMSSSELASTTTEDNKHIGSLLLHQFESSWFCYWDGSYGLPSSPDDFVFRPPLVNSMFDVVTSQTDLIDLEKPIIESTSSKSEEGTGTKYQRLDRDDFEKFASQLKRLAKRLQDESVLCISESDYPYEPILVSWESGVELSADSLLLRLGAHEKLITSISNWGEEEMDQYLDNSTVKQIVLEYLSSEGEFCAFNCGKGNLNPIPVFIVGKLNDRMVGGFLSALIRT